MESDARAGGSTAADAGAGAAADGAVGDANDLAVFERDAAHAGVEDLNAGDVDVLAGAELHAARYRIVGGAGVLQDLLARTQSILIPVAPSSIDVHATANFIKELLLVGHVRFRNIRVAVLANRVRSNKPVYAPLERFVSSLGITFAGRVTRIAPVFRVESRQARIELSVDNPDGRLKPGMFVRAQTVLDRVESAKAIPQDALAQRDGQTVVFVVADGGTHVSQRVVQPGIKSDGWVQVTGEGLEGRVVTLGQQKLKDGSEVTVVEGDSP